MVLPHDVLGILATKLVGPPSRGGTVRASPLTAGFDDPLVQAV